MMLRYVLDECLSPSWQGELLKREPLLEVAFVGAGGVLPKGSTDQEVLIWCDQNNYDLVTDNRNTMPTELNHYLTTGGHVPGNFQMPTNMPFEDHFAELILIAGTALPGEYADHIRYLPISY